MKIYVASSWRNAQQPEVVRVLREAGHDVFDFHNPPEGSPMGPWKGLLRDPRDSEPHEFIEALGSPAAQRSLAADFDAVKAADVIVAVQPFGRSAALELGVGVGARKHTAVLLARGEAELMLGTADALFTRLEDVVAWLGGLAPRADRASLILAAADRYTMEAKGHEAALAAHEKACATWTDVANVHGVDSKEFEDAYGAKEATARVYQASVSKVVEAVRAMRLAAEMER